MDAGAGRSRELTVLDQRQRGTRFLALGARSVLNSPASTGMGFWSINPYVGCEFGCTYCYARDTHRYAVERAEQRYGGPAQEKALPPWLAFEKQILVKTDVAERLARTLDPSKLGDDSLVIGTATDPYQPAERISGSPARSWRCSPAFADYASGSSPSRRWSPATSTCSSGSPSATRSRSTSRSPRGSAARSPARAPLAGAVRPDPGARATQRGGIHAGLLVAPIVPGVTDDREGLLRLMAAAKEAGARYVIGSALRLGPAARHRFLPFLAQEFPELAERYRNHYGDREGVSREYQEALTRRLDRLQRELGFPVDRERHHRAHLDGRREAEPSLAEQTALL